MSLRIGLFTWGLSQDGGESLHPRILLGVSRSEGSSMSPMVFVEIVTASRCRADGGSVRRGKTLCMRLVHIWLLTCFCVSLLTSRRLQTSKLPKLFPQPAAARGLWKPPPPPRNVYFITHCYSCFFRFCLKWFYVFLCKERKKKRQVEEKEPCLPLNCSRVHLLYFTPVHINSV